MMNRGKCPVLWLLLVVSAGCGDGLYDLEAQVTLDGQPVEGATVSLVGGGAKRNRPASGTSDSTGKVLFTTFKPNDGVLPGEYKVIVVKPPKSVTEEMASYDRNDPEDLKRIMARERSGNVDFTPTTLPRAYLNPETSPLSCQVPPKDDNVVFALDSKLGKKKP